MEISAIAAGWLIGSVPLALLVGRVIGGARALSDQLESPLRRPRRAA